MIERQNQLLAEMHALTMQAAPLLNSPAAKFAMRGRRPGAAPADASAAILAQLRGI